MRYCVRYTKETQNFRYLDQVDEILVNANSFAKNGSLHELLLMNYDKKVLIDVDSDELSVYVDLLKEYADIDNAILLIDASADSVTLCKDIPFIFREHARNWDQLRELASYNPYSIYVVEDLGFDLKAVSAFLHQQGIQVRCYPNIAQSARYFDKMIINPFQHFWIRPEDVHMYEGLVDTFEFYHEADRMETLFRIYAIEKKWSGKLRELITGLYSDVDNRCLIARPHNTLSCQKRCMRDPEGCQICKHWQELAKALEEAKIRVQELE